MIILILLFTIVSSKVCIKTFEESRSNMEAIETKMNKWLSDKPQIEIINTGTYRSDDESCWYHGGHISYYCESID